MVSGTPKGRETDRPRPEPEDLIEFEGPLRQFPVTGPTTTVPPARTIERMGERYGVT
jgi:hypothetical protein